MGGQPLLDFLGFMQLGIVDDDRQVGKERGGVGPIERVEQLKKQPGLFAVPHTMGDYACGQIQGPGQVALLVRPWCLDCRLLSAPRLVPLWASIDTPPSAAN